MEVILLLAVLGALALTWLVRDAQRIAGESDAILRCRRKHLYWQGRYRRARTEQERQRAMTEMAAIEDAMCHDCSHPIEPDDDDALLCIQCGGRNRRV